MTSDDLLDAIRTHIPADTPPLEGYVEGYYFECDCHRSERHVRFRTDYDSWKVQRRRRVHIPVFDADGVEIDHVPHPDRQRTEPLLPALPGLCDVKSHPKPWQGPYQDHAEAGTETYCWECAVKLRDEAFRRSQQISHERVAMCDCIRYSDDASGCCDVCGVTLEGEPDDMINELESWEASPPASVEEWQEFERLVDIFGWKFDGDYADTDGAGILERFMQVVQTAETYAQLKQAGEPLRAMAFLWQARRGPVYQQCARELLEQLDAGQQKPEGLIDAWMARFSELERAYEAHKDRSVTDMTLEERAERTAARCRYDWKTCASGLNQALNAGKILAPKWKRTYQSKLARVVHDPLAIREQFARKYYRASLAEPWGTKGHHYSIKYNDRANARYAMRRARYARLWRCLFKELGRDVAAKWEAEMNAQVANLEARARKDEEEGQRRLWMFLLGCGERDRKLAEVVRAEAQALHAWIDETWPEVT